MIPGRVRFSVDVRAPADAPRERAIGAIRGAFADIARRRRVALDLTPAWEASTAAVRALAAGAAAIGHRRRGPAGAQARIGRSPRWHGDDRHRRHRHVVRALQGRGKPQPGRGGQCRATRTSRRACCCASSRTSSRSDRTRGGCRTAAALAGGRCPGAAMRRACVNLNARMMTIIFTKSWNRTWCAVPRLNENDHINVFWAG